MSYDGTKNLNHSFFNEKSDQILNYDRSNHVTSILPNTLETNEFVIDSITTEISETTSKVDMTASGIETKQYEVLHNTSDLKHNLMPHADFTEKTNMSSQQIFGNNKLHKEDGESETEYDNVFKHASTEIRNSINQGSTKFQPNYFSQGKSFVKLQLV